MIKRIFRVASLAIISICLISILFSSWISYTLVFQASKASEINKVLKDMFHIQKLFAVDIIDLTKILLKENNNNNNKFLETNIVKGQEDYFPEKRINNQSLDPLTIDENDSNIFESFEESEGLPYESNEVKVEELLKIEENDEIIFEPIGESEGLPYENNEVKVEELLKIEENEILDDPINIENPSNIEIEEV